MYARGMILHAMNAPYRVAYFFTLDDNGDLFSGMWAASGEVCHGYQWDGFAECHPHYPKIHNIREDQSFRVFKGGYEKYEAAEG